MQYPQANGDLLNHCPARSVYTAAQSQKAVSVHFTNKQILPFVFVEKNIYVCKEVSNQIKLVFGRLSVNKKNMFRHAKLEIKKTPQDEGFVVPNQLSPMHSDT